MELFEKQTKIIYKVSILVYLGLFLASSFCFFIGQMWIPLGFLLGGIISIINFKISYEFSYYLTKPTAKYKGLTIGLYGLRMLLYIIGFLFCIIPQSFGYQIFFFGTCLASYLVQMVINAIIFNKVKKYWFNIVEK